jgi:hypothetical protein
MKRSYLHTDHEKQNNKNKVHEHNNKLNNNPKNTRVVSLDVIVSSIFKEGLRQSST